MKKNLKELKKIPNLKLDNFQELFHIEYEDSLSNYKITTLKPGTRFVDFGEKISIIWILLSGQVKALEEYYSGDRYIFKKFQAPEVFGEMETMADIKEFIATLITETECTFLNVPVNIYKKILKNNPEYLYKRNNAILKRVLDEKKHLRAYLMVKSIDRIKIYFTDYYELYAKHGSTCTLKITRQQISEEIGCAIKTVNRGIKKLESEDLLKIQGQRIIITETQYKKIYESIKPFINP